jgi:hypothetical protein
MLMPTEGGDE